MQKWERKPEKLVPSVGLEAIITPAMHGTRQPGREEDQQDMSARAGTPLPPLEPPLTQQSGWLGSRRVRRGGRNWLMRFPRAAPIGIFLAILAITGLSVFAIEKGVEQRDLAKARESAQVVASALDRRGNTNSSYLRAGAALTAVADDVDLPLFRRFVTELRLDGDFRGSDRPRGPRRR